MTVQNIEALRARAQARGYELLADDSGDRDRYYALDTKDRVLAAEPMTLAELAEWLDSAEADDREHGEDGKSAATERDDVRQQYNDALCGLERCKALGRAIQHESEDGDAMAPLYTVLDHEIDIVDNILGANRQWGGYPPLEATLDADEAAFLEAYRGLYPADRAQFDRAFKLILSAPDSALKEDFVAAVNAAGRDVPRRIEAAIAHLQKHAQGGAA